MSIRIMTRVWESGPDNQGELLVLLALADFADDAGNCWPSIATIAKKARVQDRSAIRIVRRLESAGYLKTIVGGGRHGCNQYRINPDRLSPLTESHPDRNDRETLTETTRNPDPPVTRTIIEPSREPSLLNIGQNGFDDFWAIYPRKVAKGAARKAWDKAVKRAPPDTIIAGTRAYADARQGQDAQYTAHPASWLNAERWTDDFNAIKTQETTRHGKRDGQAASLAARIGAEFGTCDMDRGGGANPVVPLLPARRSGGGY